MENPYKDIRMNKEWDSFISRLTVEVILELIHMTMLSQLIYGCVAVFCGGGDGDDDSSTSSSSSSKSEIV
ncbi:Hypothetical predicted protein [Octopus vulgaris]|uniref:Uncharacterized protein n=1 Tax=Octopus vulgaris TaxID=6645 RepID=A0AA36AH50_OCTVU|nr:Hypothetical predicted protein [Octopus vulgaris]